MTTLKLDNIYKRYPNAKHYSVENFNLDIHDKLSLSVLQDAESQPLFA